MLPRPRPMMLSVHTCLHCVSSCLSGYLLFMASSSLSQKGMLDWAKFAGNLRHQASARIVLQETSSCRQ